MSLGLKVKRRVERSTDPARSLKPIISDETVYDDRRSCPDVFREELFRIDCRVDDVERFYHHLKQVDIEETFPTIAHTPGIATFVQSERKQNITSGWHWLQRAYSYSWIQRRSRIRRKGGR